MKKLIRNIKAKYYELMMNYWQGRVRKHLKANDYITARYSIDMRYIYNDRLSNL